MITVDGTLEADLRKVMVGRRFATEGEALRAIVEEAVQAVEAQEDVRRQRAAAVEELRGSWAGGPDLPRKEDGSVDWGALKDEIHQGMP